MCRKLYIFFIIIFITSGVTYGQQQAMFTQYMFNGLAINPAYTGSQDGVNITSLARRQWVGMEGAPSTETFSIHGPIRNKKIALGLQLFHDEIGVTDQYGVYGTYAYRIKMNKGTLAAGLQAGFNSYRANFSSVITKTADDPHFSYEDVQAFLPNFGAGLFYNTQRFYAGFSLPLLLTNTLPGSAANTARQYRHWFATAGYVLDLGPQLKLKPNILVKAVQGAPLEIDLNANLLIKDLIWIGASYRSFDALCFLLEIQATRQIKFGYAYDLTLTPLKQGHSGSHEIMLNYRLRFDRSKALSPRYF